MFSLLFALVFGKLKAPYNRIFCLIANTFPVAAHERVVETECVFLLDRFPENTEVEVHDLPPEERICPECGSAMDEIGKETVRTFEIIPPILIIHEDRYMTYACKNYARYVKEKEQIP